jgi:hypothetical protein
MSLARIVGVEAFRAEIGREDELLGVFRSTPRRSGRQSFATVGGESERS